MFEHSLHGMNFERIFLVGFQCDTEGVPATNTVY
jgi:hypothetical protein